MSKATLTAADLDRLEAQFDAHHNVALREVRIITTKARARELIRLARLGLKGSGGPAPKKKTPLLASYVVGMYGEGGRDGEE